MKECLCSIITVCFNSEKTIRKTIESVLNQSYQNIEYIIVDGKSTDGTVDIIKEYEPLFKGRLHWISEKDQGIYDAMNKGIDMSQGELIGIINSDDYYELNAVEHMVEAMSEETYQILYGVLRILKNGIEKNVSISSHNFIRENMIGHPACFVTRKTYEKFGAYDTNFVSAADYDFMLRMSENKEVKFAPVYHIIANFAEGGMCSTSLAYRDLLKVQKKYRIISNKEYRKIVTKLNIYDFLHRRK